jgi:hypothetical protein
VKPKTVDGRALNLSEGEQIWAVKKWARIRESQRKADEAGNDWTRLNDELNTYLDRSSVTDLVQRARIKSESIRLQDALGTHAWHRDEAQRHIADLDLFLRMKELGVL